MVIADSPKQTVMRGIHLGAHDRPRRRNVVAGVITQPAIDRGHGCAGITDQWTKPRRIDLHDPQITGTVGIGVFQTGITALHRLDCGQYARRKMIERCDKRHAGQIRNSHRSPTPSDRGAVPCGGTAPRDHLQNARKERRFISRERKKSARFIGFHKKRDEKGFTLIELLVVIAILGLLIGLVAPAALRQLGGARTSVARQSIERMGQILDLYKLDVGSYPSTDEGLQALVTRPADAETWNGPYVKDSRPLLDPWNHPYIYRNPSDRPDHDYDLCSAGPAGHGDDSAHQICNP